MNASARQERESGPLDGEVPANRRAEYTAIRAEMRDCVERGFQITVRYVTLCCIVLGYGLSDFGRRGVVLPLVLLIVYVGECLWYGQHFIIRQLATYVQRFIEPACPGFSLERAFLELRKIEESEYATPAEPGVSGGGRAMRKFLECVVSAWRFRTIPGVLLLFAAVGTVVWSIAYSGWHWAWAGTMSTCAVGGAVWVLLNVLRWGGCYDVAEFEKELAHWERVHAGMHPMLTRTAEAGAGRPAPTARGEEARGGEPPKRKEDTTSADSGQARGIASDSDAPGPDPTE